MKLSQNLAARRRAKGLTQEGVAERLGVSRQAVSKWESGQSRPELELLLALADLYGCSVDDLLRGTPPDSSGSETSEPAKEEEPEDAPSEADQLLFESYDREQRSFAAAISGGVGLVVAGAALFVFLTLVHPLFGAAVFLLSAAVSVYLFIIYGLRHSQFRREHPYVPNLYTEEDRQTFHRLFSSGVAVAVAVILVDLAGLVLMASSRFSPPAYVGLFLLVLSASLTILIALGMLRSRFHLNQPEESDPAYAFQPDPKGESISGAIMLTATAIFLVAGFLFHAWHPAWIVFPLGGILCGIVSSLRKR